LEGPGEKGEQQWSFFLRLTSHFHLSQYAKNLHDQAKAQLDNLAREMEDRRLALSRPLNNLSDIRDAMLALREVRTSGGAEMERKVAQPCALTLLSSPCRFGRGRPTSRCILLRSKSSIISCFDTM
jgi:hypothetical protein